MAGNHISEESANFFRVISLLVDDGSKVLRDVLHHLMKPATLEAVLKSKRATIDNLKKNKNLCPDQYDLLIKVSPNAEDFDISLLVKIFRNICPNVTPFDWQNDPNAKDFSLPADLKRLQSIRNKVYGHTNSTKVTNTDFESLWTKLSDIIVRLSQHGSGKYPDIQQRVQMLKQANLDPKGHERNLEIFEKWRKQDEELKVTIQRVDEHDQRLDEQVHVDLQ